MPELMNYISEEMIKESFSGAENEGAERISLEDIDENYWPAIGRLWNL